MFESDVSPSDQSQKMTRRVFFLSGAGAIAAVGAAWLFKAPGIEASAAIHGSPGRVRIVNFSADGVRLDIQEVPKIVKTDGEWYRQLGANSFGIARQADTEMPFSGVTWKEHSLGLYRCLCCETALFSSKTKFESGTGWPSFWAPIAKENIVENPDLSLGVERTEVQCVRCEAHLGHVFSDGPEPTGLRYCMNSAAMHFIKA